MVAPIHLRQLLERQQARRDLISGYPSAVDSETTGTLEILPYTDDLGLVQFKVTTTAAMTLTVSAGVDDSDGWALYTLPDAGIIPICTKIDCVLTINAGTFGNVGAEIGLGSAKASGTAQTLDGATEEDIAAAQTLAVVNQTTTARQFFFGPPGEGAGSGAVDATNGTTDCHLNLAGDVVTGVTITLAAGAIIRTWAYIIPD